MRAAREAHNGLSATLANVRATLDGLTELDATARLQQQGHNEVAHDKPPHAFIQFLQALNNPFIYVLLTLGAISFVTDYWLPLQAGEEVDLTKVIIIMTMVLLSSLLRFWQEHRSAKSAETLKAHGPHHRHRTAPRTGRRPANPARSADARTGGRRYRAAVGRRHDPGPTSA